MAFTARGIGPLVERQEARIQEIVPMPTQSPHPLTHRATRPLCSSEAALVEQEQGHDAAAGAPAGRSGSVCGPDDGEAPERKRPMLPPWERPGRYR